MGAARARAARARHPDDLSFPYLAAREIWVGAVPALALRISYAGELGWELYTPTEHGRYLWDQLFDAGADLGVVACGTGAFNSLRMEKGYRFAGVDMTREHTPFEAGLGFTVHFTKPRFNGREAALARARRAGRASASAASCSTTSTPPVTAASR